MTADRAQEYVRRRQRDELRLQPDTGAELREQDREFPARDVTSRDQPPMMARSRFALNGFPPVTSCTPVNLLWVRLHRPP
jgi:hypothetical protein